MDAAAKWLKENDPLYKAEQTKNLRKKQERADYYRSRAKNPPRSPLKKFPKGD
jgi:hypothetical protein